MRRILVVDDDPHVGLAIRVSLARHGFRVAIADGGVNGLAALDNATFDLMIVDVFMPKCAVSSRSDCFTGARRRSSRIENMSPRCRRSPTHGPSRTTTRIRPPG
jgi:CheY-like chemotaxis protein